MPDVNLDAGDKARNVAAGEGNQQQDNQTRADPRQNLRGGDINFNNKDNELIYAQLLRLVDESGRDRERTYAAIHALDMKVDGLPAKVVELAGRITNLEKVEVNVKPGNGEITIKTKPVDDSFNMSQRTFLLIIFGMLLVVLVVVGWLLWRVS